MAIFGTNMLVKVKTLSVIVLTGPAVYDSSHPNCYRNTSMLLDCKKASTSTSFGILHTWYTHCHVLPNIKCPHFISMTSLPLQLMLALAPNKAFGSIAQFEFCCHFCRGSLFIYLFILSLVKYWQFSCLLLLLSTNSLPYLAVWEYILPMRI